MSTATERKPLFLPLNSEYYDAFADGSKTTEYRQVGGPWNEDTCTPGRRITLSKGYGKQSRMSGVITKFQRRRVTSLSYAARRAVETLYGPVKEIAAISIDVHKIETT